MDKQVIRFCFLAAVISLASPSAYAYLDPGTGSMILQGIIAALAALSFTLKMYWHKFTGLFSRTRKDQNHEDQDQDNSKQQP